MAHRSLLGTLKLRSVLQQRSEGHVWRSVECFGPLSSRWSGDGGVGLTVILSYLHSHRPLPKNITPTSPVVGLDDGIDQPAIIVPPTSFLSYKERHANPSVHTNTHQISEGLRWEGHSHLVQMGPGAFRQMDKQSGRQQTEAQPRPSEQSPPEEAWHILGLLL